MHGVLSAALCGLTLEANRRKPPDRFRTRRKIRLAAPIFINFFKKIVVTADADGLSAARSGPSTLFG